MPHLIITLLKVIAVLPPDSVYVSIYESNSKDETGEEPTNEALNWCCPVLKMLSHVRYT